MKSSPLSLQIGHLVLLRALSATMNWNGWEDWCVVVEVVFEVEGVIFWAKTTMREEKKKKKTWKRTREYWGQPNEFVCHHRNRHLEIQNWPIPQYCGCEPKFSICSLVDLNIDNSISNPISILIWRSHKKQFQQWWLRF